jgi:hypothetical protein
MMVQASGYKSSCAQSLFARPMHSQRLPRIIQRVRFSVVWRTSRHLFNGGSWRRPSSQSPKYDNRGGCCDRSVFKNHDPARDQPRTIKRAQMPDVVSRNDADCPDDQRDRRSRADKRQEPEKVPRVHDRRTEKRCCHRPRERIGRPLSGLASQPECDKKSRNHGQPSCELRSGNLLDRGEHGIIEPETPPVSSE